MPQAVMAVAMVAAVAIQAKQGSDANKARKSALADADAKQQAAAKEAETLNAEAQAAADSKIALRKKAVADSSTILTSPTGLDGAATTQKKSLLGGV